MMDCALLQFLWCNNSNVAVKEVVDERHDDNKVDNDAFSGLDLFTDDIPESLNALLCQHLLSALQLAAKARPIIISYLVYCIVNKDNG